MKTKVKFITVCGLALLIGTLFTGCAQKPASQPENISGSEASDQQTAEIAQGDLSRQEAGENPDNSGQQAADQKQSNAAQPDTSYGQEGERQTDSGLEQAKTAVLENAELETSQVTFIKAELDYDDGKKVYEIEFVTSSMKYEYQVKADDFSILEMSKETIEQVNENGQRADLITLEEAKNIALSYVEIGEDEINYTKLELEYDDGIAEYEVEFYLGGKEYSLTIDAVSGTVTEMEIE